MRAASIVIDGAKRFGLNLEVNGEDLTYSAGYKPSPYIVEKIAAHETEIVNILKPRRDCIAALWPLLKDFDEEQFTAFRNLKAEEIASLEAALDALDMTAAIIIAEIRRRGGTWGAAVKRLLGESYNAKFAGRRPKGYADEQWLSALDHARRLELKGPPQQRKVAP